MRIKAKEIGCFKLAKAECKDIKLTLKIKHTDAETSVFDQQIVDISTVKDIKPLSKGLDASTNVSYFILIIYLFIKYANEIIFRKITRKYHFYKNILFIRLIVYFT